MKDLKWKDEYLLGIPELDTQHKRIVDCIATIVEEEEGLTKQDRWRDLPPLAVPVIWQEVRL